MMSSLKEKCCGTMGPVFLTVLRIVVGVMFLVKGIAKLQAINGVVGMLTGLGFPAPETFAWILALLETVGGALLIVGALTHLVTLALFANMVVAFILVHLPMEGLGPMATGSWFVLLIGASLLALGCSGLRMYGIDRMFSKEELHLPPKNLTQGTVTKTTSTSTVTRKNKK
ncbi:MAG: DoxX family protein [Candidatus Altimarinota bacterium]|jgi:putative oxidoreductase